MLHGAYPSSTTNSRPVLLTDFRTVSTSSGETVRVKVQKTPEGATLPGYTYTETQFFQMTTSRGKSPSFQYRFGYSSLPVGWSWASEKGAMGLSNNHIVWWRDDLTPAASKRAQPVEIVFNGNGKFWAFGSAAHHSCFRPLTADSEMPYDRGFSVTGKVGAPRQQGGGLVSLTSTYPWGASGVATARLMASLPSASCTTVPQAERGET